MNDAAREAVEHVMKLHLAVSDAKAAVVAQGILAKLAELDFIDASRLTSEEAALAADNACQAYDGSDGAGLYGDMKAAITAALAVAKGEKDEDDIQARS